MATVAEAQKIVKFALEAEAQNKHDDAADYWFKAAKIFLETDSQNDTAAMCFVSQVIAINTVIIRSTAYPQTEILLNDFTRALQDKLMQYPLGDEYMRIYYSRLETLLTGRGYISLGRKYRIRKKEHELAYAWKQKNYVRALRLSTFRLTTNYGESFQHLLVFFILMIVLFSVMFSATGALEYKSCGNIIDQPTFDLIYYSCAAMFGITLENIVPHGSVGKIISMAGWIMGSLNLALLVNMIYRQWYND